MALRSFIDSLDPQEIQYLRQRMDNDPSIDMDLKTLQQWIRQRRASLRSQLNVKANSFASRILLSVSWDQAIAELVQHSSQPLIQKLFKHMFEFFLFYDNMPPEEKTISFQQVINMMNQCLTRFCKKQFDIAYIPAIDMAMQNPATRKYYKSLIKKNIIPYKKSRHQLESYIQKKKVYGVRHPILETLHNKIRSKSDDALRFYLQKHLPIFYIED